MMIDNETANIATRVTEFWNTVASGPPAECWPWQGYVEDGYGKYSFAGRMRGAHELALTFWTGERRHPSLDTCHSCNNPICCNPHHLRFDTRKSNVEDMDLAGRRVQGPTKLTAEQVATIRLRIANGARQQELAVEFGVSNSMISMIKTGKRYAHGR